MIKRSIKKSLIVSMLLAVAALGGAQPLGVTGQSAVQDGIVAEGEYSWSESFQTITLHLSRTNERLFAAVEAESEGWVGIGFGSDRMTDAHIFIGLVRGDKVEMEQHGGSGHSHRPLSDPVEFEYAVRESGGATVMELSIPAEVFITEGQRRLELIIACGKGDRTRVYHSYRRGVVVDL
jgi:hypothetical protein